MNPIFSKSLAYLSYRAYCEYDLRLKLEKHFSTLEDRDQKIEEVIIRLKELQLLNDHLFAENMVRRLSHKGNQFIIHSLKQKKIAEEIISEVINELKDETERALLEAKKKLPSLQETELRRIEHRLSRFLVSRGFGYQSISQVIRLLRQNKELVFDH